MELVFSTFTEAGRGEEAQTQVTRFVYKHLCHQTVLSAHYWVFLTKRKFCWFVSKNADAGTGEMPQWLRALPGAPSSITRNHI